MAGGRVQAPAAATVLTPTPVAPLASCSEPALTQPFTFFKDFNYYTLAPGGTFDFGR